MAGLTKHLHDHYPDFDLAESDREATRKYLEVVERVKSQMKEMLAKNGVETADEEPPKQGGGEDVKDATREYLMKVGTLKGMLNQRARGGAPSELEYAK